MKKISPDNCINYIVGIFTALIVGLVFSEKFINFININSIVISFALIIGLELFLFVVGYFIVSSIVSSSENKNIKSDMTNQYGKTFVIGTVTGVLVSFVIRFYPSGWCIIFAILLILWYLLIEFCFGNFKNKKPSLRFRALYFYIMKIEKKLKEYLYKLWLISISFDNIKNKKIKNVTYIISLFATLFLLGLYVYPILSFFIFGNIAVLLKLDISILIFALVMIFLYLWIIADIIRTYKKRFWFVFGISVSLVVCLIAYQYMNDTNQPDFPTAFYNFSAEGFNLSYNAYNQNGYPFARQGNQICWNMSIMSTPMGKYDGLNISYAKRIQDKNGNYNRDVDREYIYIFTNNFIVCDRFTETGLNIFYPNITIKTDNQEKYITGDSGHHVYVTNEQEYNEKIRNMSLIFILALGTIPIILSSVKTIKELYNNKN